MVATRITLTPDELDALRSIARQTGKTQDELLHEAVDRLIAQFQPHDRLTRLRAARGMWRDRDDLATLRALCDELDRFTR